MANKYLDRLKSLPLRKYLELSLILYFFALAALCAQELISEAPSVRFPVGAPMFFDMIALSIALLISSFMGTFARFAISSSDIQDEVDRNFLLSFALFFTSAFLYANIQGADSDFLFSNTTIFFVVASSYELLVRSFLQTRDEGKKAPKMLFVTNWMVKLRQSYGLAVPVFALLSYAGHFQLEVQKMGVANLLDDLTDAAIVLSIIAASLLIGSTMIVRKHGGEGWSKSVNATIIILLSIAFAGFNQIAAGLSETTLLLIPLLIGYFLFGANRAQEWYFEYYLSKKVSWLR